MYHLKKIIVTGGGRKNIAFVKSLQDRFTAEVLVSENIGLDGDSLEAEAFGYLAVRSKLGKPLTFKNRFQYMKNQLLQSELYNSGNGTNHG